MTTYKKWIRSLGDRYVGMLEQVQRPVGLFLYDTPHTIIKALTDPVRPLLLEKNMPIELVDWDQVIELQKAVEPLEVDGPELFRTDPESAEIALQASKELERLAQGKHLLIVVGFVPPSHTVQGVAEQYYDEGAAQWLLMIADKQLQAVNRQGPINYERLLWVLSPCSQEEWGEKLDLENRFFSYLMHRLWYSSIVNGDPPPCKHLLEHSSGPSELLKEDRYLPTVGLSPIERKLRDALDVADVEYMMQYQISNYRLDFAIIKDDLHIDVECDGQAYHSSPEQIEHDRQRNNALVEQGWIVLRYSGRQIVNHPFGCVGQILRTLASHGASVQEYIQDASGAFVPPVGEDAIQAINAAIEQVQLEKQLKRQAELEIQRQAILNNPEYARNRERIEQAIAELAQTLSKPLSKR